MKGRFITVEGIEGVDRVTSTSRENFGTVSVEFRFGYDIEKALADVKNAVDQLNSFPRGSEKPIIVERKFRSRTFLEYDRTPNALRDEMFDLAVAVEDAHALVPTGPGLGVRVDRSAMKSFPTSSIPPPHR